MTGNQAGDAAGEIFIFKIVTFVIIALIFGAAYIFHRELRQTGGDLVKYVKPVQQGTAVLKRLPPAAEPEPAPLQPPLEIQPKLEIPTPRITTPPVLSTLPAASASAPTPVQAPAPDRAPGVRMLPAPVTEVHPLSDAEEVMGAASSEVGEVGVTRTFTLPDEGEQDEILPLPND
jgi:hypothetical protein